MVNYTDNALVSAHLKRDLTDNENLILSVYIPAIRLWIDRLLGTTFLEVAASTKYYDGGDGSIDIDPCYDITEIASIDGYSGQDTYLYNQSSVSETIAEPINETTKIELRKRAGCFPAGENNIRVLAKFSSYSDGIPEDIQLAATKIAADLIAMAGSDGNEVQSESLEGHSVTYRNPNDIIDKVATDDPLVRNILELRRQLMI